MKRAILGLALSAALVGSGLATAAPAGADPGGNHHHGAQCTGTPTAPGTLVGTYNSDVVVTGVCVVDAGPASVRGDLTVTPGSALLAVFGLNDQTGTGNSNLSVRGDVTVGQGASLLLGCEPYYFSCLDDSGNTLTSNGSIGGDLEARGALAVVVHASSVGGSIEQGGGGGGQSCVTPTASPSNTPSLELWATLANSAPYSDYEDLTVGEHVSVRGLSTCWLGANRLTVGHDLSLVGNQLADPDGVEVLSNNVAGDLVCFANSYVWDSSEANFGQAGLFPRTPQPNTVGGERRGQCVLSSPTIAGGPSGPGPF